MNPPGRGRQRQRQMPAVGRCARVFDERQETEVEGVPEQTLANVAETGMWAETR